VLTAAERETISSGVISSGKSMVQRGGPVLSKEVKRFSRVTSVWKAVPVLLMLQQVLGLYADRKEYEKLFSNREMLANLRRGIFG
jgi:hypothetical protein